MLHNCFYLPTPNPPPLLSITAPLHLPCITRRRYILSFLFSPLLSNSNKKVMAVVIRVRGNEIIHPLVQLMADVIEKEDTHHILQFDLRPLEIVVQDIVALQVIAPPAFVKIWLQLLHNSLAEAKGLLDRSGRRQRCLDWLVNNPRRQSQQIRGWNAFFNHFSANSFITELPMFITSLHFLSSKPLLRKERVLLQGVAASRDGQPLSRDEAWMLFRRVAFKDVPVSMDIEERARIIADECRGRSLAINVVAAAMIGQSSVEEWDNCLSSVKKVDPSFPPTHPHLDAELCRLLRWSYDSLPNSNVKNCFLYCAFYKKGQRIDSRQLVEMWIGEGLIKSKQGAYSMDMAIGRSYVKLLLHRSLFHIVKQSGTNVLRKRDSDAHDVFPSIGVKDAIREMAMYIAQKEENCLFMRGQNPPNLPEADYAKCRRISFPDNYSGALPTDLRCPNLTTLILQGNRHLELLPTELLLSRLTSLRVLNMSGCTNITSVPTSVGQLRLLQFLSLSGLPIKDLGEEVCHLSELQFLDLSWCRDLQSLPSQIGQLKNLKHLNLQRCDHLKMIPREISELTSLSRLQLYGRSLSVGRGAPASIWSLTGLQNLTELQVFLDDPLIDGIMGTWSDMRHLVLYHPYFQNIPENPPENLPDDMQNMKKLQTLVINTHPMLSLPNCKFEHLERVKFYECHKIRKLSALEWLPNLKYLKLYWCNDLTELGIGSRVPSGYLRLQKLVLKDLENLESLGGPSSRGVWDERTLPHLRVLQIDMCPRLKRLPIGMEKLRSLCALEGQQWWWESIMWEDPHMKFQLQKIFVSS